MFSLQYSTYLISGSLPDAIIKLSSFTLLMLFAFKLSNRMNGLEAVLLLIYFLLFASTAFPSLLYGFGVESVTKYLFMSLILPILIVCYRSLPRCDDFLISTYIVIGVLFSVQAIVACILVNIGILDKSNIIELEKYGGMESVTFGIWGLGNAIQSEFGALVLRAQGWFIEPSILASFLLLPAFGSVGRYRMNRRKKYLLSAIIIFIAILLTLSLAGFFAVVCAALLIIFSKPFYGFLKRIPVIKYSYIVLILLSFLGFAYLLLNLLFLANEVDLSSVSNRQALVLELLGRNPDGNSGNLVREIYKINLYINLINDYPFGVGFNSNFPGLRTGNAMLHWLTAGGILAVLIIIVKFTYIFIVYCHPLLISGNAVFNALAASFIGSAIHNLSYGTWIAPYFLIHLALLIMSTRKEKMKLLSDVAES
jgi:hypothetical protein